MKPWLLKATILYFYPSSTCQSYFNSTRYRFKKFYSCSFMDLIFLKLWKRRRIIKFLKVSLNSSASGWDVFVRHLNTNVNYFFWLYRPKIGTRLIKIKKNFGYFSIYLFFDNAKIYYTNSKIFPIFWETVQARI